MTKQGYNDDVVRSFIFWSLVWGTASILVGILISFQLVLPELNFPPHFTYGRLRPLHTNAGIFGWGIGSFFAALYFIVQRLTRIRIWNDGLAKAHLWLFNITIALAAISLLFGLSSSKEYHELEWPLDIMIVVFWVMFSVNLFMTIWKRKEESMYISLWYTIAALIGIAILFLVNAAAVPVSLFKSYSAFAGTNDANVQWWFGHNAVAMVLTVPPLAVFYYFLPKAANLPIYSHRLSIVAFWSLIFMYLWTGAHHLLWTPVPDWIETLAMGFSIMLIAPSWGVVVNGYMTLDGNWHKLRENYLIKFFIAAITFYGLQTLQGPAQAIRAFSAFIHYTEWVPGHVHMGTMGWVSMVMFGAIYYMHEKINNCSIYSVRMANQHFWLAILGQMLYSVSLWIAGVQEATMWQATTPDGALAYTFIDTLVSEMPFYWLRALSGIIYLAGLLLFFYNLFMTSRNSAAAEATQEG